MVVVFNFFGIWYNISSIMVQEGWVYAKHTFVGVEVISDKPSAQISVTVLLKDTETPNIMPKYIVTYTIHILPPFHFICSLT